MALFLTVSVIRRFWAKVNKTGDDTKCWLWTGCLNSFGYGQLNTHFQKKVSSHRLSYLIHYGSLPSDKLVCHTCNNKACVNPKHLYLGNHTTNGLDASRDGLLPSGKNHYTFFCDETVVKQVFELRKLGHFQYEIAEKLKISQSHISRILNNKQFNKDRKSPIFASIPQGHVGASEDKGMSANEIFLKNIVNPSVN